MEKRYNIDIGQCATLSNFASCKKLHLIDKTVTIIQY